MPRSIARPTTPTASCARTASGNSVTTSTASAGPAAFIASELRIPVHGHAPLAEIDLLQVARREWHPPLPRPVADDHHRSRRVLEEVADHPEPDPLERRDATTEQVLPVILA